MDIKNRYTGAVIYSDDAANIKATLLAAVAVGADLSGADLRSAVLSGADLRDADLRDADLRDADLRDADLRRAVLSGTQLPDFSIVPAEGSFIAYKKTTTGVIKIMVPEHAKRVSSLVGRKCRASSVIVIAGDGIGGTGPTYSDLTYTEGLEVVADSFNDDIRIECTNGIHFFMTEKEAREYE